MYIHFYITFSTLPVETHHSLIESVAACVDPFIFSTFFFFPRFVLCVNHPSLS